MTNNFCCRMLKTPFKNSINFKQAVDREHAPDHSTIEPSMVGIKKKTITIGINGDFDPSTLSKYVHATITVVLIFTHFMDGTHSKRFWSLQKRFGASEESPTLQGLQSGCSNAQEVTGTSLVLEGVTRDVGSLRRRYHERGECRHGRSNEGRTG